MLSEMIAFDLRKYLGCLGLSQKLQFMHPVPFHSVLGRYYIRYNSLVIILDSQYNGSSLPTLEGEDSPGPC